MVRAALWGAAVAAVGLSFALNGYFWFATMAAVGWQVQWLSVAVSVLSGTFKSIIPAAMAANDWTPRTKPALAVLFVGALTFDLASGLGFSTLSRGAASHEHLEHNARIAEADRLVSEAEAARKRLAAPRVSVARLREDIAGAEADKAARDITAKAKRAAAGSGCDGPRAHVRSCRDAADAETSAAEVDTKISEARGALADAEAYEVAAAKVVSARKARAALGEPRTVDPQAEALAKVFSRFGADAGIIGALVGGLMLLVIELGSTAAVAAANSYRPTPKRPAPPTPKEPNRVQVASIAAPGGMAVSASIAPDKPAPAPAGRLDLATALKSVLAGSLQVPGCTIRGPGELHLAQQPLAEHLGTSKPTISRALKALEAAGVASVQAGRQGTTIKFH